MSTDDIKRQYTESFAKFGRTPASVLCPKGRQSYRYKALLNGIDLRGKRLLDFGCGLAHLAEYLDLAQSGCEYYGVDVIEEFVLSNREALPKHRFDVISSVEDIVGKYDVIVASGVFNLMYLSNPEENRHFVFGQIEKLFSIANYSLSVDFLSSNVDFIQNSGFHPSVSDVAGFAADKLTRRIRLDHSYLPFEFSLIAMKDAAIDREKGIYRGP